MVSLASYFFKLNIAGKTTWDTSHHIKGVKTYALHKLGQHRRITLENAKESVTGFLREAQPSTLTQYYRECAKNEIASEHCHVTDAPKDSGHTDAFCDINGFMSLIPLLQDLPDPPLLASSHRNSRQDTTYTDISLSHARARAHSQTSRVSLGLF
jgi:hypothetical protein